MGGKGNAVSGGGLSLGSITNGISTGMGALSLLNTNKNNKNKMLYMQEDLNQKTQSRKNLLEQQLATRRAQIGGMGIGSSASSVAAQQRMVREAYQDIGSVTQSYNRQIQEIEQQNTKNLRQGIIGSINGVSKIIK